MFPQHTLYIGHAIFTPDAGQTVDRFHLNLSRTSCMNPVLTSSKCVSTHLQWFPCGHLLYRHLTDIVRLLNVSLTTLTFGQSSIHRLATPSCKAVAGGQTPIYTVVTNERIVLRSHGTLHGTQIIGGLKSGLRSSNYQLTQFVGYSLNRITAVQFTTTHIITPNRYYLLCFWLLFSLHTKH